MKKNIGLIILTLGALIIVGSVVLTPAQSYNPADSTNGTEAAAAVFFGGVAVLGIGIVMFANALPSYKERSQQKVD